jgi:hypothetical protein
METKVQNGARVEAQCTFFYGERVKHDKERCYVEKLTVI